MRTTLVIMAALAAAALSYGLEPSGFQLVEPEGRWFSPDISHQLSFGYTSSRSGSWGTGTYLSTMSFRLHPSLTAEVDLGYSRIFNLQGGDMNHVLGGVDLDWRPTDDLKLQFHYSGALPTEDLGGY